MSALRLGERFTLPLEAVTETFAILAVKRAGKSNAAVVFAEELYDNDLPWVAVDPKGDWWGVRSSADGKKPGLSVVVFGGEHADVPLEVGAGRYIADLIAEQRLTCVLDVSEMTKADQRRFLQDFAERLYRRNREPLMVFCEEADEYIPQRVAGETAKVVGAFETLVKRGGFRGIGVTLITQRSASLNKDVLTQAGNLFAMQTPSPQDQDAIKAWIRHHSTALDVIAQLPTLQPGEAWFFSPAWLRTLQEVRFRRRRTFDSGATPKIGEKQRPPTRLADVDLAAIKEAMAETIEKVKAEDPKELRKQIAQLKAQLATKGQVETKIERVEVPVLSAGDLKIVQQFADQVSQAQRIIEGSVPLLVERLARLDAVATPVAAAPRRVTPTSRPAAPSPAPVAATAATGDMPKAQRAFLSALATHGVLTDSQLGFLAGYAAGSGHFKNTLGALRGAGYVEGTRAALSITQAGVDALGEVDPLPTGRALLEYWYDKVGKAPAAMLAALVAVYPGTMTDADVEAVTGYAAGSGHFKNSLGRLRGLGLVTGSRNALKAHPTMGEAGG